MIRRTAAALLAIILIFCAMPAFADTETMYITDTSVQVYYSPSISAKKYTTGSYGEKVTVAARNKTWAQLTNSAGAVGYCKVSALSSKDPNVDPVVFYVKDDGAKVYRKTSTASTVLTNLEYGSSVRAVAITPDKVWLRIESGEGYGYIKCAALMKNAPSDKTATVYVKSTTASLRQKASANSAKQGTAYFGEEFTLSKLSGNWGYVSNGVVSGWCKKTDLSLDDQAGAPQTYYVVSDKCDIYARKDSSLGSIAVMIKGDEVSVVAFTPNGKYAMVEHNGVYGYVAESDISASKEENAPEEPENPGTPEEEITVYVIAVNAAAYKTDSEDSQKVGTVSFGEQLTCTKYTSSWALVKNSAGQGWVRKSALSTDDPLGSAKTYYTKDTGAKLLARPLDSAKQLCKLTAGTAIEVLGTTKDGSWHCVSYNGSLAYVSASSVTSTAPEKPVNVYVRYDIVTAYKSSSSSSGKVGEVCYGDELKRLRISGDWALVSNEVGQGWVKNDALTTINPNSAGTKMYVSDDTAVVYKKPAASSKKIATLVTGESVMAVAKVPEGYWMRIEYNGGYAFMKTSALTDKDPGSTGYRDPYVGTAGDTIERVCAIAVAQYGKPYIYAEEGPDSYDCTGLMWYAFSKGAGVYLKRTGHEQGYDTRYTKIESISDLKRGDILVFNTIEDGEDDLSDHTGLYLGGGEFIHASSGAGKVIVSTVKSGYYNRKFSWALRIIE